MLSYCISSLSTTATSIQQAVFWFLKVLSLYISSLSTTATSIQQAVFWFLKVLSYYIYRASQQQPPPYNRQFSDFSKCCLTIYIEPLNNSHLHTTGSFLNSQSVVLLYISSLSTIATSIQQAVFWFLKVLSYYISSLSTTATSVQQAVFWFLKVLSYYISSLSTTATSIQQPVFCFS